MDKKVTPVAQQDFELLSEGTLPDQFPHRMMSVDARFLVTGTDDLVDVKLEMPEDFVRSVADRFLDGDIPEPQTIIRIDYRESRISIFPQITYPSERLYKQKYDHLREIQLEFEEGLLPVVQGHYDVFAVIEDFPGGLIKDATYGFGFVMEMRPLVKALEKLKGINRLVIADGEETRYTGETFYLEASEYDALRAGMSRISRHHQAESLAEREVMAHNHTIHKALPGEFHFKERPYRPGTVFKLLGGTQSSVVDLRGRDRIGVLNAVARNASAIAARDPQEFVQLQKDIEIVGLDRLITSVESHIKRNSVEGAWQKLLELNPFLLSMLFGQPIVLLQGGASVGGQRLSGSGTKIADFLTKNSLTHNAALVELKRPKTNLLGSPYREGVYPPSQELMASVTQVLDQRLKLTTNLAVTKMNSRINDLEVASVECVVVAGRTPTDPAQMTSLELIRSQFKDVRIITFDELLERLQILRELLTGERYVSEIEDDEGEVDDDYEGDSEEPRSNPKQERQEQETKFLVADALGIGAEDH